MEKNTNDKFEFETFRSTGGRIDPAITIGDAGGIGISASFIRKYGVDKAEAVLLLYDRGKMTLALKFLQQREKGAKRFKVAQYGGSTISARDFFVEYDLDPKKLQKRYEPQKMVTPDHGEIFAIQLRDREGTQR